MHKRFTGRNETLVIPQHRQRKVAIIAPNETLKLVRIDDFDIEYLSLSCLENRKGAYDVSSFLQDKELLFALINSTDEYTCEVMGKAAITAHKKDIPAIAILDFSASKVTLSKFKLAGMITRIKKIFNITILTDLDFYKSMNILSEPEVERASASKIIPDLIELFSGSEASIFSEFRNQFLKNRLALACYGSSNSPTRAIDATRRALQNTRSLNYDCCIAKVLGDYDLSTKETNYAVTLLKEAVGDRRQIAYDIKRDIGIQGVEVLLILTGLNLGKIPDFRENPLRTLYNMEPESGVDEPLGFDLDIRNLE